jgi:hypothetical protein
MNSTRWVQHISGQGEKWSVLSEQKASWTVLSPLSGADYCFPKSEYRLCAPPERWVDVTDQCEITDSGIVYRNHTDGAQTYPITTAGYRFNKVQVHRDPVMTPDGLLSGKSWAFTVEQKVTE